MIARTAFVVFFVASTAFAARTTYTGHRNVGTGSADLTIVTDGKTGVLATSNVVDWKIALKNGADSITLRPSNSGLQIVGSGLSATATELRFTFGPEYTYALFQRSFPGSSEPFYCLDTSGCGGRNESLLAAGNVFDGNIASAARSGTIVIAKAAAAPAAPVAKFQSYPPSPKAGETVQFTDKSSNSPTSWRWDFGDGETHSAKNPPHRFSAAGNYTVRLEASNGAGSDREEMVIVIGSATSCPLAQPAAPTDPDAVLLEEAAVPRSQGGDCASAAFTLHPPRVYELLDGAVQSLVDSLPSLHITRTSGFRPKAYQQHWRDVRDQEVELRKLQARDPASAAACSSLQAWISYEIDKHCLRRNSSGDLAVGMPAESAHTVSPSRALDLGVSQSSRSFVASQLEKHGLAYCASDDAFHVQLKADGNCKAPKTLQINRVPSSSMLLDAEAEAEVRLLVTDDRGRRIGYDPITGLNVNEFPAGTATYRGGTEIVIGSAGDATYEITAFAMSAGAYAIAVQTLDSEHGDVVDQRTLGGTIDAGETTEAISIDVTEDEPPVDPATVRRRAVRH